MTDVSPPLTRRERLRRVVLLCSHFMRNLAYHRGGLEFPTGWLKPPLVAEADFWITLNGNFIEVSVLEWCKLFGDPQGLHGWMRVTSDPAAFKAALLAHLGLTESELEDLVGTIRFCRDKFVAHLDDEREATIPQLEAARACVEFYHKQIVTEAAEGDLIGLADTAEKLRLGYEECEEMARSVYRANFGSLQVSEEVRS